MSEESFEKLRDLAREEFGVEISRSEKASSESVVKQPQGSFTCDGAQQRSSFKEVFGFDVEEVKNE